VHALADRPLVLLREMARDAGQSPIANAEVPCGAKSTLHFILRRSRQRKEEVARRLPAARIPVPGGECPGRNAPHLRSGQSQGRRLAGTSWANLRSPRGRGRLLRGRHSGSRQGIRRRQCQDRNRRDHRRPSSAASRMWFPFSSTPAATLRRTGATAALPGQETGAMPWWRLSTDTTALAAKLAAEHAGRCRYRDCQPGLRIPRSMAAQVQQGDRSQQPQQHRAGFGGIFSRSLRQRDLPLAL